MKPGIQSNVIARQKIAKSRKTENLDSSTTGYQNVPINKSVYSETTLK